MTDMQSGDLLADLKVLDLGSGMSAALVTNILVTQGAQITRFEPATGDPFYALLPAYEFWQRGKDTVRLEDWEKLPEDIISAADICIIGGDDHPLLAPRHAAEKLAQLNPRLVILRIQGQPDGFDGKSTPAVDLLAQCRTGIVNEVVGDQPIAMPFPAATYGAALNGSLGLWAALVERERSGLGQIVDVSFVQGTLTWMGAIWLEVEKASAATDMIVPRNARHTIFRCADGRFIHFSLGVPNSIAILTGLLGIESAGEGLDERGMPAKPGEDDYFGNLAAIQAGVSRWQSDDLVKALREASIPVEYALPPGACWDDEQIKVNGIIKTAPGGSAYVGSPIPVL